jgi:cell division GTPase FtsZ
MENVNETVFDNEKHWEMFGFENEEDFIDDYTKADDIAGDFISEMVSEITEEIFVHIDEKTIKDIITKYQNQYKVKYGKYNRPDMEFVNDNIDVFNSFSCETGDLVKFEAGIEPIIWDIFCKK